MSSMRSISTEDSDVESKLGWYRNRMSPVSKAERSGFQSHVVHPSRAQVAVALGISSPLLGLGYEPPGVGVVCFYGATIL